MRIVTVCVLLVMSVGAAAGQVASITCSPFGGTSYYAYRSSQYFGDLSTTCSATCTNGPSIGVDYFVFWSCNYPADASIAGYGMAYAIIAEGTLVTYRRNNYGCNMQSCDGTRSGYGFFDDDC